MMPHHILIILSKILILSAIIVSFSCTPPQVLNPKPELPQAAQAVAGAAAVASVVNVPITMRTQAVEDMINSRLTGLLFESDTLTLGGIKNVKLKVWKEDSLRISFNGDELRYQVPLKILLRFSFTLGALGVSHTEYQDVEAALLLTFRSRLFVKNDWQVVTMTKADSYEWLSDPVLRVRFITIPVKPLADYILSRQQEMFAALIDKEVNNVLNIKGMLGPMWAKIQEPINLSTEPPLWLRLAPLSVYLTQLTGVEGEIRGAAGIRTVAETFIGEAPEIKRQDSLPQFIVPGSVDSSFVINLYCEIGYAAASNMLRGYLQGRNFTAGRREVIIQNVEISGLEGYAIVSLDFIGSYNGRIYVYGRPVYDSATSTVSIEDLDFDLNTQKVAHRATEWLLHGIILTKVKPYLRFALKEKLLETQLAIQKMLCHKELMDNVYISGVIDELNAGGVTLTDKAIRTVMYAKGSLQLSVQE
jgi:hypothetical protein